MSQDKPLTIGQQFGSLGGTATLKRYGKDHFKNLSKLAAEKRTKEKELRNASKEKTAAL